MTINDYPFAKGIDKLQLIQSIFRLTSDGVYVIDTDGVILEVNKTFEEMNGWTQRTHSSDD